jgi:L-alanine-DL-glutamate epimerase-like enolase superfamily enzyme
MGLIKAINIRSLELRFDKPLGGSKVSGVDIIVAEIRDSEGLSGLGFSYVIGGGTGGRVAATCQELAERFLLSKPVQHPAEHWKEIKRSFNRTGDGPNVVALAALDVANWDLKAHRDGVPLCMALGGSSGAVPIYASGGFSPDAATERSVALAERYVEEGFRGVKPRVNATDDDARTIAEIRHAVGQEVALMVDANEKGDISRSTRLLEIAAEQNVAFVEEPLPADDPLGYRVLGALKKRAPIAVGEHLQGLDRFDVALADGYAEYIQPDLAMIGGLTPCLEVAKRAARRHVTVAPHFLPGLFVQLHGSFDGNLLLESFPLIEDSFDGWPRMKPNGTVSTPSVLGHGLRLKS